VSEHYCVLFTGGSEAEAQAFYNDLIAKRAKAAKKAEAPE
jgi:hypothetical protein